MRLNAGIITEQLEETPKFYTQVLEFGIVWESDWFLLLSTPGGQDSISFLLPDHPSQAIEHFKRPFGGEGVYLTIEMDDVDNYYNQIKSKKDVQIALDLRSEEWGDRHFAIIDPNNIGIDFVTHAKTDQ